MKLAGNCPQNLGIKRVTGKILEIRELQGVKNMLPGSYQDSVVMMGGAGQGYWSQVSVIRGRSGNDEEE
jgi:hypothetical protein